MGVWWGCGDILRGKERYDEYIMQKFIIIHKFLTLPYRSGGPNIGVGCGCDVIENFKVGFQRKWVLVLIRIWRIQN